MLSQSCLVCTRTANLTDYRSVSPGYLPISWLEINIEMLYSMLYNSILSSSLFYSPCLTCILPYSSSQVLEGGYLINCSLGLCRKLLRHERPLPLLEPLFAHFKLFEICVGINGRVWINSDNIKHTLCIALYLNKCEYLPETDLMPLLKDLVKRVESSS